MKRIMHNRLVSGFVFAAAPMAVSAATGGAASNPTPTPTSAIVKERVFNDCPTSTLTTVNNYPSLISFDDQNVDCFGFANLHIWRFSTDATNAASFDNNASFRFSATLKIEGTGNGEGGLQVSPWWGHDADGLFNVRSTDGEIACFGGRLPFFTFTGTHGLHYVKGTEIGLAIVYEPRALNAGRPATIEYRVTYGGNTYSSGVLPFDEGNPAEDPPHGLWGMLNDANVGGHFKAFLGQGSSVGVKATFTNIDFTTTPNPNAALARERVFNDCPTSTLTTVNNYPSLISFDDQNVDCFGFANFHIWRFSEDGGTTAAIFNNNAQFRFSADFKLEGSGNGEGGLQISPWWGKDAEGLFNVRSTDGEIAVFGGLLPFFNFSAAPNNVRYTKGTTIHLEMIYTPNGRTAASPATAEYRVTYGGNSYTSGALPFGEANPAEDPPYGLYGMLNDGQSGGHFKAFLGQGSAVNVKATFSNISFSSCDYPIAVDFSMKPHKISSNSKVDYVTAYIDPPAPFQPEDVEVASVRLNGLAPLTSDVSGNHVKVKFDRQALLALLPVDEPTDVTLTGFVGGQCFEATDQVEVHGSNVQQPTAQTVFGSGSMADIVWWPEYSVPVEGVSLYSSFDGGMTWNLEATGLANSGYYRWHVPGVVTSEARIGIQFIYEVDHHGPISEIDIAESDNFSIAAPVGVLPQGHELALYGATPNPGRGLNVSFSLPNGDPASISVFDVSGRQVRYQDVGSLGAGRHTVSLASSGRLPVGVYLVQLNRGTLRFTSRAVVIE